MERNLPTINLSAAIIFKNATEKLRPSPTIGRPQSVKNFVDGLAIYTAMKCITLFQNGILCGQSSQSVLVYNFSNMHAMSQRSDVFGCSYRANIKEPAFWITIMLLSAVSWFRLPSCLIPTAMLDSKSLNTLLLEVMISSQSECVCICDLSDLTLQIVFDAWWASMNVASKPSIAWNDCRHGYSWRFYLHCRMEETASPGIICIICNQVFRHPSEHGTTSMGKQLLEKAHIAKFNELTA